MKKLCIVTCWFEWTWGWRIASILENSLSENYKTTTLIWFYDKGIYPIKWKKLYLGKYWKKEFPLRWWIALIPHIINTIRYLRKEQPDVVMSIGSYCNFLWLIAQKFLKFKLLLTQHEHISTKLKNNSTYLDRIQISIIKKLIGKNKIVCVSHEVLNDTVKYYNIPINQALTIYNWFNFDNILKLSKEKIDIKWKYIINIWALNSNKNQEMLVKSYAKSKCKKNYKLLFLWEWPQKECLWELAKDLNIEKNVIFAWFSNNPYKFLKNASLFCFTSLSEALPTVLIEALILKIPVLTVPVIWSEEILDNWNCWIIAKDWDINDYSQLIDKYIEKDNSEMIKKWYEFAKSNFGITVMINNYKNSLKIVEE